MLGCRCHAACLAAVDLLSVAAAVMLCASLMLPCCPLSRLLPAFSLPFQQILLFSATFNERVKRFAQKIVPDANQVRG